MIHSTRGIVFHHIKYSETSIIAKIYTELFGLQSYLIKGIRSRKSKTKSSLLQHLSLLEMEVYHKEKSKLHHIKEMKSAYQYTTIPFDIRKSSIVLFINEILYKSILEEEPNQNLFDFIYNSIQILDLSESHFSNFHLLFMVQLTKHLGFFPKGNYSHTNNIFNMQDGVFQKNLPLFTNYLAEPFSGYLNTLQTHSFKEVEMIKIAVNHRKELLQKLVDYYRLHLSGFREIKSHEVLYEVLND